MFSSKKYHGAEPCWQDRSCVRRTELPPVVAEYLFHPGSFTKKLLALQKEQGSMRISILNETSELATHHSYEYHCLCCRYIFVREIQIFLGNKLMMYARSVLPKDALGILKYKFRTLNTRPLGSMLFSSLAFKRSDFQIAKIWPSQPEYCFSVDDEADTPSFLWARRSMFSLQQNRVLLTEVFSPAFIDLLMNENKR